MIKRETSFITHSLFLKFISQPIPSCIYRSRYGWGEHYFSFVLDGDRARHTFYESTSPSVHSFFFTTLLLKKLNRESFEYFSVIKQHMLSPWGMIWRGFWTYGSFHTRVMKEGKYTFMKHAHMAWCRSYLYSFILITFFSSKRRPGFLGYSLLP